MTMHFGTPSTADAAPQPEPCRRCRGKGLRWFGRNTPPVPCGTCKGLGYREFKASAEKRARTRELATARKARKLAESIATFQVDHPQIWQWMHTSAFPFAGKMRDALLKYGSLTDRQMAASQRCVRRDT